MLTSRTTPWLILGLLLAPALDSSSHELRAQTVAHASARGGEPGTSVRYGSSVPLGNGRARSYLTLDAQGNPAEVGIALDENALEGLPATGIGHHGLDEPPHIQLLDLPAQAGLPFRFVELNWNPSGHEPDGVYEGMPHFDFHFYTISKEERETIVPTDPRWAERANNVPGEEYVPPFNAALGPPGAEPAQIAVPLMGLHWVDVRSAELQALLGNPEASRPFTATFIHGSWDGRFIFWEPMITRAHILAKKRATDPAVRDEIIPIPMPARYQQAGYYPAAYRIAWDAQAREYRIALTQLAKRS